MKTKFKYLSIFLVVIVFAIALAACGGEGEGGEEPYTIGVSNSFITSEYRTQMIDILETINQEFMDEGLTLASMAQRRDPFSKVIYASILRHLDEPLGEEAARLPLRQLTPEKRAGVETGIAEGSALYRDRMVMLRAVDERWVRHLTDLDALREGIGLRAFAQVQPLVAYKKEAHEMYVELLGAIEHDIVQAVYKVDVVRQPQPARRVMRTNRDGNGAGRQPERRTKPSLGRNDPCWCGSGRKYKHCHMRSDKRGTSSPNGGQTTGASTSSGKGRTRKRKRSRR